MNIADPIVSIQEDGYYVALWFLSGKNQDWLAMLYRNPGEADLRLSYRFRYYKDDKVFMDESEDEKSGYTCEVAGKTEDDAIAIVDAVVAKLVAAGYLGTRLPWKVRERVFRRIVKGGGRELWKVMSGLPFVHMKKVDQQGGGATKKGEN